MLGCALLGIAWLFLSVPHTGAQNTAAISQGFQTNETDLTPGAIVSIEPGTEGRAQLGNTDRLEYLLGVIGENPLVALSSNTTEIQVVTSGVTPTLVSNINGDVQSGDKITASPINGVGMKATASSQVIGTAQEDFTNIQTSELTINDREGQGQVVRVGLLPVQVNVTYYVVQEEKDTSFLPEFVQQIANAVAGREVSVVRVLIALLVLLLGFISAGILLYSAVQSSIISIGRNPLSEGAVQKSLIRVGLTAFGILLVMVVAIYLILRT